MGSTMTILQLTKTIAELPKYDHLMIGGSGLYTTVRHIIEMCTVGLARL